MVKTMFRGTTIEIWSKDYINDKDFRLSKDLNAEILQIEHAYDDLFMVEIRRINVEGIAKTKRVLVEEDLEDERSE